MISERNKQNTFQKFVATESLQVAAISEYLKQKKKIMHHLLAFEVLKYW